MDQEVRSKRSGALRSVDLCGSEGSNAGAQEVSSGELIFC